MSNGISVSYGEIVRNQQTSRRLIIYQCDMISVTHSYNSRDLSNPGPLEVCVKKKKTIYAYYRRTVADVTSL